MKRLLIGFIGLSVLILAACTNSPEASTRKLQFLAKTDCELVYKARGAQVIENFCETEWKPVKVFIDDQTYSVSWINEKTSRYLFEKGCGQTAGCYYELSLDGVTVNGRFAYITNIVKGEYTFEIDANENSKLLNETSTDLPS
ncbi:MAG: hypothetical protein KJ798_03910 [Gammaproteobacteria bacterium]|uniref:hypothetical protein n=1 Tax=Limnobacter sp. TaxID=2003368 RepID=UPI00273607E9|nr:hypothetical protein [Limnobacter sp.]MBU1779511.1 hypothetical protein [Gammaproteobacteria bacterium]MBU2088411.1 hypothetical protein [Gammaproteobacteria bacterium]MDP3187018.1 hypothetical protein [Limnobacter sp.]